jgi:hypothetical protein
MSKWNVMKSAVGCHVGGGEVRNMKGRAMVVIAGALVALLGTGRAALAILECPNADNCAEVKVAPGTAGTLGPGDTFDVNLTFKQGPDGGQGGGIGQIAALALTLTMGSATSAPLRLATCNLNSDNPPFPVDDVIPDPSVSNFRIVVENASCENGRTHCLCPTTPGAIPDNFINLVIYGPKELPTPGPNPIDIPVLPPGPQTWVTLKLKVANGARSGEIPLNILNQVSDASRPPFTAFLSVGDKLAVDQTCVVVAGQPPCSAGDSVSQVAVANASVNVMGVCVGDCDGSGTVTVDEVVTMVDITLGTSSATCPNGDPDGNGIDITDIVTAVNNALVGCS